MNKDKFEHRDAHHFAWVAVSIMIFSILIYAVLSWKIYGNNKNKLEPVHVFQLNYFLGVSTKLSYGILLVIVQIFYVKGEFHSRLCLHHFLVIYILSPLLSSTMVD